MDNPVKADYDITYEGKDITLDLQGEVVSVIYRDKTAGEADELTLNIKDEQHKWKDSWNPKKGDTIIANITSGSNQLQCGTFTVDNLSFTGNREGGHMLCLQALSAGVKTAVRTKTSFAHEGKSLKAIAEKIADKYNYKVQGIIHNYSINRVTQFHETDIEFLHRVALEFGYMFTLRGNILVFSYLPELNMGDAVVTVDFGDIITDYNIIDKVAGIYVRGQNRYHNSKEKKLYDSLVAAGANPSADVLRSIDHVDNDEQGLYKVDGRMYKKNLEQVEIDATFPGNVLCVGGVNASLTNWFNYSGKYLVGESTHQVDRENNYTTSAQFKKILQNAATGNAPGDKVGYS